MGALGTALKGIIDTAPLPPFMKEAAKDLIDGVISSNQQLTTPEAQDAVDSEHGDMIIENALNVAQQAAGEADGEEGGNWLVALAKALGQQSGAFLKEMVELGEKIGNMDAKEDPEAFAEMQAQQQANTQMFKLASESTSTVIKSIGEGLSSIARKQ